MLTRATESKFNIMLIDDSPLIHRIVSKVLKDDYNIYCFVSAYEAINFFDLIKPNLVLLDVEMPDINGFEAIKLLIEKNKEENFAVIFITAKTDIEFEIKAFELGAVDYITKPFANQLLKKRVQIHLSYAEKKIMLSDYNNKLKEKVTQTTKTIKELQSAIVSTLADLVEMRDETTGSHVLRTQEYFKLILEYLKEHNIYQNELNNIDTKLLLEASQLHDIGKIAIPDAILLKPAKLTLEEFEIMKTHTIIGYNTIIKAMKLTDDKDFLNFAAEVALTHHEKWDGTGYPKGLKGEEIPISGRIMAIVDVYDALVSERAYKTKKTHEKSLEIISKGKGKHFDPKIVDAVIAIGSKFDEINNRY